MREELKAIIAEQKLADARVKVARRVLDRAEQASREVGYKMHLYNERVNEKARRWAESLTA